MTPSPSSPHKSTNTPSSLKPDAKKQTIFQSRRRDDQKPLLDNSGVTGMIPPTFDGVFKVGKNGIGFVTHRDSGFVVMVETHHNPVHAIHGDVVTINILSKESGTGEVIAIVRRGKNAYAGLLVKKADWYYFQPTDPKEPEMRLSPVPENVADAINKKVLVTLGEWVGDVPTCQLKEIIGEPGKNDTEILSIVMEKGFDRAFPDAVEKEAQVLHGSGIPNDEISKRRDMRGTTTFTIDPVDAKDFDDALSWKRIDDKTLEIGVHIADVSAYVQREDPIDKEAHRHTRVRRPNDNAHLERFNRTVQEECFRGMPSTVADLNKVLPPYLRYYNERRLHFGFDLQTPLQVLTAQCFQGVD
jgi:exoribonuclease R